MLTCPFDKEEDFNSILRTHIKKVDLFVFETSLVYIVSSGLAGPLVRPRVFSTILRATLPPLSTRVHLGLLTKDTVTELVDRQLSFIGGGAGTVMGLSPEHP